MDDVAKNVKLTKLVEDICRNPKPPVFCPTEAQEGLEPVLGHPTAQELATALRDVLNAIDHANDYEYLVALMEMSGWAEAELFPAYEKAARLLERNKA